MGKSKQFVLEAEGLWWAKIWWTEVSPQICQIFWEIFRASFFCICSRQYLVLHYIAPMKRIREQKVRAHLLIYSFSF